MVFGNPHLPLVFRFICGPEGGGKVSLIWLRRRGRLRDAVQIVVFAGGPLLGTIVPLGNE